MSACAYAAKRIVTCDRERGGALGVVTDGAVVWDAGRIRWVGPRADVGPVPLTDFGDRVITPGLVDAHTHAAWVGSRHDEYARRMSGSSYGEIAAAGGGIMASHRAVSGASLDAIESELRARLARMAAMGVTTVEVKSGYGLEAESELKQLRAIARAASDSSLPHVVPTFLALHALPESAARDRERFVLRVATHVVPEVARARLASFVDAYVDEGAFTVEEARLVGEAARDHGLGVRLHVGQFRDVGGARLCAELRASSADHLEHLDRSGAVALRTGGTVAVLLPIASFTLGQEPPPVALLREVGVPIAVASDANPGTAPSESLPLAMALAVRLYGLTPDEVLLGATRIAAQSLALTSEPSAPLRGELSPGAAADLVVWDLPHEHAIVQPWGVRKALHVLREGVPIA